MFLFDTDTLSFIIKRNPPPLLLRRLANVSPEEQFTSTINVGELVYGAYKSSRPEYFLDKLEQFLWPNINIIPFDISSARTYGRLRAELEKKGTSISEPDLRIASIALAHDLTLVTGNLKHFSRIKGLKVDNWMK